MLTNKYDGPLNSAAVFALTVSAALYSFIALLNLFLLWLSPFFHAHPRDFRLR